MEDTAITLRSELERNRPKCSNKGFPSELRIRAGRWALDQQAAGQGFSELARELGVSTTSVRTWALSVGNKTPSAPGEFVRVEVGGIGAKPDLEGPQLHTPMGYRVSGLGLPELVTVLRGLE